MSSRQTTSRFERPLVRRSLLWAAAALASAVMLGTAPATAEAEWKPTRPIKMLIAYRAGGGADTLARLVAEYMERSRGWKVIPENKSGGAGGVMASALKQAKPDGHTIGMAVTGAFTTNPLVIDGLTYTAEDFDYLGTVARTQMVLFAKKDAPFDDLDGMAAWAKQNDGIVIGSMGKELDLLGQLIAKHYGIQIRLLPARGGAGTIKQVLAGEAMVGFNGGAHHKYVTAGDFKVIVNLNDTPLVVTPQVKNLKDHGIDFALQLYFQFQAPKGLPAEVRAELAKAIDDAVRDPKVVDLVGKKMQMELRNLGPEGLSAEVATATASSRALIEAVR